MPDRLDYLVRLKLLPTADAKIMAACQLDRELLKVENPSVQLHVYGWFPGSKNAP